MKKHSNGWDVVKHRDLIRVLVRHDLFSSAVSAHPAVPNGMDPPRHTAYRRIIDHYFEPTCIGEFEATCRELAGSRWDGLRRGESLEIMEAFARPYALDTQCAFVGWPESTREPLARWLVANQQATREQNRERLDELAAEFQNLVEEQLENRRELGLQGSDVTTRLMKETLSGRPLTGDEITSILRNWTVGELATIASAVGILAEFLARERTLQSRLRRHPEEIPYAIEEILRIHAPLWSNRRVVARTTILGGRILKKGERLTLLWGAANQDEEVFPNPTRFESERDQSSNLLYGAGIHVCPGAPLARLELRVAVESMLQRTTEISLGESPGEQAERPATGWAKLWLKLD